MTAALPSDITPLDADTAPPPALVALNNDHAALLSFLAPERFRALIGEAFLACRIGEEALLVAFDQAADYDSPNFLWFRDRFERFVYVDRIVVDPRARGRGLARRLDDLLFERACAAGHARVVCEVNADPPNPGSDAFHAALGFAEIGSALLANGKAVRYFMRDLT